MFKKIILLSSIILILFSNLAYGAPTIVDTETIGSMDAQEFAFAGAAGLEPDVTVGGVLATVIKGFLSLLGIIFVILMISGGYNWMTAAGNEEKVAKAKDTIIRAVIGLVIVASAYAITYFVFKYLGGASGGPTTTVSP